MAEERQLFFDTSALVKYFHEEAGSERVTALIEEEHHTVWISTLARIEFASAMHRKYREDALPKDQLHHALTGFGEAVRAFRVHPLGESVVETAKQLIQRHGQQHALRTLDALHLATFVFVADSDWQFVVADDRLYTVAREEGCSVIHPVREVGGETSSEPPLG